MTYESISGIANQNHYFLLFMDENLITIGFPVYNVERYVKRSLLSALDQDFPYGYEVLIVDDCGTDTSMEIVKSVCSKHPHRDRIRIIRHNKNKGLGAARNTIIENATSKYLFFLDSDDWMKSECLSILYNIAEARNAEVVCASSQKEYEGKEGLLSTYFQYEDNEWTHDSAGAYAIAQGNFLATTLWNKLFRLDFLKQNNIRTIHRTCEDQWFTYTCWLYARRVVTLSKFTYCYNIRQNSIMTSMYEKEGTDETAKVCCDIVSRLFSLIQQKFNATIGAYDLYYKAIAANFAILQCANYSDEQRAYINKIMKHAARRVPSIKKLLNSKNKFIYICSKIYDRPFSFCKYSKWYEHAFGR